MYQRPTPQTQTNNNTPTPMAMGTTGDFFAGADSIMGLTGTFPAYCWEGAGGGALTGRETEGTAADARGDAMVAAGSKVDASKTSTICSPNETTSPAFNTRGPAKR